MKVFLDTNIFLEYFQRRKQYKSVSSIFDDLEDSFQHQCAIKAKCDVLITINKKHFPCKDIPVMTPEEFLETQK